MVYIMINDEINNVLDDIENHENFEKGDTQAKVFSVCYDFEPKILELQRKFLERLENILEELNR